MTGEKPSTGTKPKSASPAEHAELPYALKMIDSMELGGLEGRHMLRRRIGGFWRLLEA